MLWIMELAFSMATSFVALSIQSLASTSSMNELRNIPIIS